MIKELKKFNPEKRPKVLVIGNGINRAFADLCWKSMIMAVKSDEISETEAGTILREMPYSLAIVAVTNNNVRRAMKREAEDLMNGRPPEAERELLRAMLDNEYDAIITTNYTYELEQSLDENFSVKMGRASKYRKKAYDLAKGRKYDTLLQYMNINADGKEYNIWHMHGEAAKPDTMIIGHYDYGVLLSKMQDYVGESIKRYRTAKTNESAFQPRSWIDYFIYGDVEIIGQGLDYSEMVLWWIINCKQRHKYGEVTWHEVTVNDEKRRLCDAMGVKVEHRSELIRDFYKYYYWEIVDEVKQAK